MNFASKKNLNLVFTVISFVLLQNNLIFGQTTEKSPNQNYLDSIIQLLPVIAPEDTSMRWLVRVPLDSLPDLSKMNDDEILRYTYQLADKTLSFENQINHIVKNSIETKLQIEQSLKAANEDESTEQFEIDSLKKALKFQKSLSKSTLNQQKIANKTSKYALECTKLEVDDMRKALPNLRMQVVKMAKICEVDAEVLVPTEEKKSNSKGKEKKAKEKVVNVDENEEIEKETIKKVKKPKKEKAPKKKKSKEDINEAIEDLTPEVKPETESSVSTDKVNKESQKNEKTFKKYDVKEDVMLNPTSLPCNFLVNKTDEFSGKVYKEMVYEEAFRFTNDFMKSHLNGKPHIVCEASLSTLGELLLLNLKVTINETNALKSFAGVKKNGTCVIKLINNSQLIMESVRDEEGIFDEVGGFCVFNLQFASNKNALKQLQKSELDKIRIAWKKGYEEYEIYNVDIFKKQSNCLEAK
jgi:hypothetical protein